MMWTWKDLNTVSNMITLDSGLGALYIWSTYRYVFL